MIGFRLFIIWLHIIAAAVWIGGMVFLGVVLVPLLRSAEFTFQRIALLQGAAVRFRALGWACLVMLLGTGLINLIHLGVTWDTAVSAEFWRSSFGRVLALKIAIFIVLAVLAAAHDFIVGPRAVAMLREDPTSPRAERLRWAASWMGRLNLVLSVIVVALAVMLVRGNPW